MVVHIRSSTSGHPQQVIHSFQQTLLDDNPFVGGFPSPSSQDANLLTIDRKSTQSSSELLCSVDLINPLVLLPTIVYRAQCPQCWILPGPVWSLGRHFQNCSTRDRIRLLCACPGLTLPWFTLHFPKGPSSSLWTGSCIWCTATRPPDRQILLKHCVRAFTLARSLE